MHRSNYRFEPVSQPKSIQRPPLLHGLQAQQQRAVEPPIRLGLRHPRRRKGIPQGQRFFQRWYRRRIIILSPPPFVFVQSTACITPPLERLCERHV